MKTVKIYHFDPITGQYLGAGVADPDPMDKGNFLHPDFSTTAKPPKAKKGFEVRFISGAWELLEIPKPVKQPEPEPPTTAELAAAARAKRNKLLRDSDYTQLTDLQEILTPDQRKAWKTYRQQLRDLPTQAGFPDQVKFPDQPE